MSGKKIKVSLSTRIKKALDAKDKKDLTKKIVILTFLFIGVLIVVPIGIWLLVWARTIPSSTF